MSGYPRAILILRERAGVAQDSNPIGHGHQGGGAACAGRAATVGRRDGSGAGSIVEVAVAPVAPWLSGRRARAVPDTPRMWSRREWHRAALAQSTLRTL